MVGRKNRRQTWLVALALLATCIVALPTRAQSPSGEVKGVVKDAKGSPVDGAKVVLQAAATSRKTETKTDKKGEFSQFGLAAGTYSVTATKDALLSLPVEATVRPTQPAVVQITLMDKAAAAAVAAGSAAAAKEEASKVAQFTAAYQAGLAASNANRPDEAIDKFNQALALSSVCKDCYNNIGFAYVQKKDYDKAEEAYKKGNEVKPNAESYSGLASVYTTQKKFNQATEASAKAAELSASSTAGAVGGNADALFNQGVTLWNGGKIEDAKKQFQAAIQANPNHAEAHYQLGMALVNEGNLAGAASEWEAYLKLAPSGPHVAEVNAMLPALKK